MPRDLPQKHGRVVHMLNHLPYRDHVVRLAHRQLLDRLVQVRELALRQDRRVAARVLARDLDELRGRVDGGDAPRAGQPRGGFCEDAAAAADVKVGEDVGEGGRRVGLRRAAGGDERMAVRVHRVQHVRGAVRGPPFGGEGLEVGDLFGVYGGGGGRGRWCGVLRAGMQAGWLLQGAVELWAGGEAGHGADFAWYVGYVSSWRFENVMLARALARGSLAGLARSMPAAVRDATM